MGCIGQNYQNKFARSWLGLQPLLRNASLLQDGICHDARGYGDGYRECALADRAVPHLMATLALAHKGAAMLQQKRPQLRVKTAAHGLKRHSLVHRLVLK